MNRLLNPFRLYFSTVWSLYDIDKILSKFILYGLPTEINRDCKRSAGLPCVRPAWAWTYGIPVYEYYQKYEPKARARTKAVFSQI